jgi:hypothetical protein
MNDDSNGSSSFTFIYDNLLEHLGDKETDLVFVKK